MNTKIEVSRFPDRRLKVLTKYPKDDANIRIEHEEVSICPRMDELALEKDVLEAIDLWNRLPRDSTSRFILMKEIYRLIERHIELKTLSKV